MNKNNNYVISQSIERIRRGKNTRFLDSRELLEISYKLKKSEYKIFFPYDDCDKVILYNYCEPKICLLEIQSYHKLSHSEILGSLFGINIDGHFFGDIIIYNDRYYVMVLPEIRDFVRNNLIMVGNKAVKIVDSSFDIISNYKRKYQEEEIIVSSLRIDNVIARIIGVSRSSVKEKIQNKEIILNYSILKNNSYTLKENDIFSIRKYGKYRFGNIIKSTRKDNYVIKYYRYI